MAQASWIAIQGIPKEEALARMEFRDTGDAADMSEVLAKDERLVADLPDGWFLVYSDDSYLTIEHNLKELSSGCRVVVFDVVESVNVVQVQCFENGEAVWDVTYDGMSGPADVDVDGSPPEGFTAIRDRCTREQQAAGPDADVDYMFSIPVETAALALRGFRYDQHEYDGVEVTFTRLERM